MKTNGIFLFVAALKIAAAVPGANITFSFDWSGVSNMGVIDKQTLDSVAMDLASTVRMLPPIPESRYFH